MAELHLRADDDHVERPAHENDPVRAIVELIWNAIDAEAPTVTVELEHDDVLGGIVKTVVTDTGHGIDRDELDSTFGRIGGSWKRFATKTKNDKRGLHGERGEGRLRAFALGSRVAWESHSIDASGILQRVEISGTTEHRHAFEWNAQPVTGVPTGTVVTAFNDSQKSLGALEAARTRSVLLSHFAQFCSMTTTCASHTLEPISTLLTKSRAARSTRSPSLATPADNTRQPYGSSSGSPSSTGPSTTGRTPSTSSMRNPPSTWRPNPATPRT
jgi:hypothetical protein